jgi:O-antigen/teichoic acid export membrane protein
MLRFQLKMSIISSEIRKKTSWLRSHAFVRNTATLQAGSTAANIYQAIVGIILARILQPNLFGVYALVFGLAGLISILLGVGAQDAVLTMASEAFARNDRNRIRETFSFLAKVTLILGVGALIGACIAPLIALRLYHDASIGLYAAVIVCASLISTTAYSFTSIGLQIVGRIRALTVIGLLDQVLRTTLALLLVIFGFGITGIVVGHFVGALVVFLVSVVLWRQLAREHPVFPHIKQLLAAIPTAPIKKYFRFSIWIAIDRNLSNLYNILPIMIAGIYISTAEISYFKVSFAYINLALSLLGPVGVLLNSEFPKMKAFGIERMSRNFVRISVYAFALSSLLGMGAATVAPLAFRVVYGAKYLSAIPLVFGLIPYAIVYGIGVGLGSSLRALDKVKVSVILGLLNIGIGLPLGLFLARHFGVWGIIAIVTFWYAVAHVFTFFYVRGHLRRLVAAA